MINHRLITLPQVKFVYNKSRNWTAQLILFEITNGQKPYKMLELIHLPCIEQLSVKIDNLVYYLHSFY